MNKFNVACFQLCSSENVEENITMIENMFKSTKKNIDLICLPECSAIFTDSKKKLNTYHFRWHKNLWNSLSFMQKKKLIF